MGQLMFTKEISKGSRFNQVYIPKHLEQAFEPGDTVEVRLVSKKTKLFFHNAQISDFKETLIRDMVGYLGMPDMYFVGSFLTKKTGYRDIDVVIVEDNPGQGDEQKLHNRLTGRFELNLHVTVMKASALKSLLIRCPLTRAMFSRYVSASKLDMPQSREIDEKHIKFLLMMPRDLLNIDMPPRVYYDCLRRLVTIERFLENQPQDILKIEADVQKLLGKDIAEALSDNVMAVDVGTLRKIIKAKIRGIEMILQK